jgi:hypothetical protein
MWPGRVADMRDPPVSVKEQKGGRFFSTARVRFRTRDLWITAKEQGQRATASDLAREGLWLLLCIGLEVAFLDACNGGKRQKGVGFYTAAAGSRTRDLAGRS